MTVVPSFDQDALGAAPHGSSSDSTRTTAMTTIRSSSEKRRRRDWLSRPLPCPIN